MEKRVYPKRSKKISQVYFNWELGVCEAVLVEFYKRVLVRYSAPISDILYFSASSDDPGSLAFLKSYLRKFGVKDFLTSDSYFL